MRPHNNNTNDDNNNNNRKTQHLPGKHSTPTSTRHTANEELTRNPTETYITHEGDNKTFGYIIYLSFHYRMTTWTTFPLSALSFHTFAYDAFISASFFCPCLCQPRPNSASMYAVPTSVHCSIPPTGRSR